MSTSNSGLTAATTPLTGTEVMYVVQGGNSRKATTGNLYIPGGTDVAVTDGGTGASTASAARTNLGLAIGTNVQAWDADLDAIAALTTTTFGRSLLTKTAAEDVRTTLASAPYVATRTALKALDTTKDTVAILTESGREGIFLWRAGNFSTFVTADATEGLYVKATAIASSAGAWVRRRDDLDVQLDWFGTITGANAGANAATNDAAFASAKGLSNVLGINYGAGIYEHAVTLTLDRNRLSIKGYGGFPVFGTGGGTYGTIVKWTGSSGGVIAQINEASGNDTYNNHIEGIEFDGNVLASVGIDVRNSQFASVENCSLRNFKTSTAALALRCLPLAVAGTGLNCVYRGKFKNLAIQVGTTGCGVYVSGVTGVGNTTFCCFEEIHVTHENEGAFYLIACDDNSFINCAASRVAGGSGAGLKFDGTGTSWVVGNTFYMFHAGVTDTTGGPALVIATGAKARQNKIYGLSGVDFVPTVTRTGGAHLQFDYIGSSYTSVLATEAALNSMTEAHLTALRLGSDYTTYATETRDVNANDKVIANNPGTGGYEYQIGGVATINYTLGAQSLTSAVAGAGVGPSLDLYRAIVGAASNSIGYVSLSGQSTTGVKRSYVDMFATILTATNGAEDAQFQLRAMVGGTLSTKVTFGIAAASFPIGINSTSPTAGVGYATGAGGAVTQLTSRATGVTLNKVSGAVTMFTAAGSATPASFTVTNSTVAATDTIILNIKSGASNTYFYFVTAVAAGSFVVTFWTTGGTASDTPVLNFNVVKGVAA